MNLCVLCDAEAVPFGPYQTDPQLCLECAEEMGIEVERGGEDK